MEEERNKREKEERASKQRMRSVVLSLEHMVLETLENSTLFLHSTKLTGQ